MWLLLSLQETHWVSSRGSWKWEMLLESEEFNIKLITWKDPNISENGFWSSFIHSVVKTAVPGVQLYRSLRNQGKSKDQARSTDLVSFLLSSQDFSLDFKPFPTLAGHLLMFFQKRNQESSLPFHYKSHCELLNTIPFLHWIFWPLFICWYLCIKFILNYLVTMYFKGVRGSAKFCHQVEWFPGSFRFIESLPLCREEFITRNNSSWLQYKMN